MTNGMHIGVSQKPICACSTYGILVKKNNNLLGSYSKNAYI